MRISNVPASAEVGLLAKFLLHARGSLPVARAIAENAGAPARVLESLALKAAVAGASTLDSSWAGHFVDPVSTSAFFESLRHQAAFFALLETTLTRVPLRTRTLLSTSNAPAWVIGKGAPIPVTKLNISKGGLQPVTAAALMVVSEEIAESSSPLALRLVNRELGRAVSDVVFGEFLNAITDSSTPIIPSAGNDEAAVIADLDAIFAAIDTHEFQRFYFLAAPDVAKAATLAKSMGNGKLLGGMGLLGGEIGGVPCLVSGVIPAGELHLIDGSQIAADGGGMAFDVSGNADVQMADDPTNNAANGTGSQMVNMFQANAVALRALVTFGAERMRPEAHVVLHDVAWGAVGT